ncbi:serine/threonine-protein kinase [Streptomyces sp. NPDC052225]|uniref:serine/threonine-protein kinase n=1 Tax=Streptomyces sp. NPDC052225 TaxID=3154949 RepID=UPI003437A751
MNDASGVFKPLQADDPTVVAGYRIAARLGAGGMGRVYLSHTQGGRPVAIKVVRPEIADDPDFRRRFRREMEAARRVRGAYTAELIDGDADGTPPWLATLYVPGPSLAEAVARRGPMPVPAVLWLMAGVAEALQAIHGAGIVHRDLKPSNVLLASDGPRVIDFGISLASGISSHTVTGTSIGTPQFMAPEQAAAGAAGAVTAATDVFSLGQTAAFAALGEPLYGDGPAVSVLYRIVHDEPDLSRLPARLRPLMARCLAADPADRAGLAEIVEWCRRELGPDADAGAGPAVWREAMGPEVTVPGPVPSAGSAPVTPSAPSPTRAYVTEPLSPWRAPDAGITGPTWAPDPAEQRARRRRNALIGVAGVTAGLLMLTGLGWTLYQGLEGNGGGSGGAASQSSSSGSGSSGTDGSGGTAGGTGGSDGSGSGSGSGSDGSSGSGSGSGSGSAGSGADSESPRALAYPMQMLNGKNSLSLDTGKTPINRKQDIRFTCAKETSCALESDKTMIAPAWSRPKGESPLDSCRAYLKGTGADKRMPLAAITTGSEICFGRPDGTVGMLVVETKSTAMPDIAFLTGNLTLWPASS